MKRCILLIITIILVLLMTACGDNEIKYESWKDTIESFGDGTYQVIHQVDDGKNIKLLSNVKHNQCTITKIKNYKAFDKTIYFVGEYHSQTVFCKLDSTTNLLRYYVENKNDEDFVMIYLNNMLEDKQIEIVNLYDDFSEDDKEIFSSLDEK